MVSPPPSFDLGRLPGIPASAAIAAPAGTLAFLLAYDDTPPSLNVVGSRGASEGAHWSFTAAKQEWQNTLELELMRARVPRGLDAQVFAGASMRFPKARGRDSGNFSTLLEKALGDALTNYRAIPDDTADRFWFTGVEFEHDRGQKRTTIVLWLIEKENI